MGRVVVAVRKNVSSSKAAAIKNFFYDSQRKKLKIKNLLLVLFILFVLTRAITARSSTPTSSSGSANLHFVEEPISELDIVKNEFSAAPVKETTAGLPAASPQVKKPAPKQLRRSARRRSLSFSAFPSRPAKTFSSSRILVFSEKEDSSSEKEHSSVGEFILAHLLADIEVSAGSICKVFATIVDPSYPQLYSAKLIGDATVGPGLRVFIRFNRLINENLSEAIEGYAFDLSRLPGLPGKVKKGFLKKALKFVKGVALSASAAYLSYSAYSDMWREGGWYGFYSSLFMSPKARAKLALGDALSREASKEFYSDFKENPIIIRVKRTAFYLVRVK